ncbi:sugar ABC transporter ATP-binding protein [Bacillota bacterium Meth-B3]
MAFLTMRGIVKRFPGVLALGGVDLSVEAGEVHALLGENGAGKSTLMKVLSGAYMRDAGDIFIEGKSVCIRSAHDAQALGISIIHQELNLVEQLSVAENIFMGRQPMRRAFALDWRAMNRDAQQLLDSLGIPVPAKARVSGLGVAHKQMVEVAKALSTQARILIMDEPTAPLTAREIDALFDTIRSLKRRGVAVIYISHRLEEVMDICDRATIMRDGENVAVLRVQETSLDEIIRHMVGRELKEKFPKEATRPGEELLRVEGLRAGRQVRGTSLSVRAGEVLGVAGLVGAGRTETARALFGMDARRSGEVYVAGRRVDIKGPRGAIDAGLGFATEDRKLEGLVLTMSVAHNITLAALKGFARRGKLDLKRERRAAEDYIGRLRIKTPSPAQLTRNLSGGNQQKVVLAKWLMSKSRVLILDEPTRGIDVGAKIEVYHIMNELKRQGVAVVMISSELPEILGMSDRVAVMCQGEVTGVFDNDGTLSQEKILYYATGGDRHGAREGA